MDLFMICHEDADGMEYGDTRTFDTKAEARAYAATLPAEAVPKGTAVVLYACEMVETLREGA